MKQVSQNESIFNAEKNVPLVWSTGKLLKHIMWYYWASNIEGRHSNFGLLHFLRHKLGVFVSTETKQCYSFLCKEEFHSLALMAIELTGIQSLISELKIQCTTLVAYCDNQSRVAINIYSLGLHSRTKHMVLDFYFVRERALAKSFIVLY